MLYEPSLGLHYPPGAIEKIEARVADGDHEGAVIEVLMGIAGMTHEELETVRSSPTWLGRIATAPTIAREARIEDGWDWQPEEFAGIQAPTLVVTGSQSPADVARLARRTAAALPNARLHLLQGHGHFAHRLAPDVVADALRGWQP